MNQLKLLRTSGILMALLAIVVMLNSSVFGKTQEIPAQNKPNYSNRRVIVSFNNEAPYVLEKSVNDILQQGLSFEDNIEEGDILDDLFQKYQISRASQIFNGLGNCYVLEFDYDADIDKVIEDFSLAPQLEYVEKDVVVQSQEVVVNADEEGVIAVLSLAGGGLIEFDEDFMIKKSIREVELNILSEDLKAYSSVIARGILAAVENGANNIIDNWSSYGVGNRLISDALDLAVLSGVQIIPFEKPSLVSKVVLRSMAAMQVSDIQAQITSPENDEFVTGEHYFVEIRGVATATGFNNYQLFYKLEDSDDDWTAISEQISTPVSEEGELLQWNVRMLDAEKYLLRLVVASSQETKEDIVTILLNPHIARLSPSESRQEEVEISDNRVVWQDDRNGNRDIYLYDFNIEDADRRLIQITSDPHHQMYPSISGTKMVWVDKRHGSDEIYLYDLENSELGEQRITTNSCREIAPEISGNKIIWAQRYGHEGQQIYLYDLDKPSLGPQQVSRDEDKGTHYSQHIDGNKIVWFNYDHYDNRKHTVFMYDLNTPEIDYISVAPKGHDPLYPNISGDIVVWRSTHVENSLYYYDLSKLEIKPDRVTKDWRRKDNYDVSGNWVVWEDIRRTYQNGYYSGNDIYLFDIAAQEEKPITIFFSSKSEPKASGDKVVWSDSRDDRDQIYYYVSPITNSAPVIGALNNKLFIPEQESSVDITATDSDGDPIELIAQLEDGTILNATSTITFIDNGDNTASLTWTPTRENEGEDVTVKIIAQDLEGLSSNREVTLSVIKSAELTSHANGDFLSEQETFVWSKGKGINSYQFCIGTSLGLCDVKESPTTTSLTYNMSIPQKGQTVYATICSRVEGGELCNDYTFQTVDNKQDIIPTELIDPAPETRINESSVRFTWKGDPRVEEYRFGIGSEEIAGDIFYDDTIGKNTFVDVSGIPLTGKNIYVFIATKIYGSWKYGRYTYETKRLAGSGGVQAMMTSPSIGETITKAMTTFEWSHPTATAFWFRAGSYEGGGNYVNGSQGVYTFTAIGNIALNGGQLFIALHALVDGEWMLEEYVYDVKNEFIRMTSPTAESTITSHDVTFEWQLIKGDVSEYKLEVGSSLGSNNILSETIGKDQTSKTVSDLVLNGRPIYVRLSALIDGEWIVENYSYQLQRDNVDPTVMVSPLEGELINTSTPTFTWRGDSKADKYKIKVGTTQGASDIFYRSTVKNIPISAANVPLDGQDIYVRLETSVFGDWTFQDYTYTTINATVPTIMKSPVEGSLITTSDLTFEWESAGIAVSNYWLQVGTVANSGNIYSARVVDATSVDVSGISLDGNPIYVQLRTDFNGDWLTSNYTYQTRNNFKPTSIISPTEGTFLSTEEVTFEWETFLENVTEYYLQIGTKEGTANIFSGSVGTDTSVTVDKVVLNWEPVYVKLVTFTEDQFYVTEAEYRTQNPEGVEPTQITSPAKGATIDTTSFAFQWQGDPRVEEYFLMAGFKRDQWDIYSSSQGTNTSVVVTGIPLNGETIYARLAYRLDNRWFYVDSDYLAKGPQAASNARLISPVAGSTITTNDVTFEWNVIDDEKESEYFFQYGRQQGTWDELIKVQKPEEGNPSVRIRSIDLDNNPIYIRLLILYDGNWIYEDVQFQASDPLTNVSTTSMSSPADGTTLTNSSVTFEWTGDSQVQEYRLQAGWTQGSTTIYDQSQGVNTSATLTDIPLRGDTVYVRLMTKIGGQWTSQDYQYPTSNTVAAGRIVSHVVGSVIKTSDMTLQFSDLGQTISGAWIRVGTSEGQGDIFTRSLGTSTSVDITNIPLDGNQFYVRFWFNINQTFVVETYAFNTEDPTQGSETPTALVSPEIGTTIRTNQVTFEWDGDSRVGEYRLQVGRSKGSSDIYNESIGQNKSATVSGIPVDNNQFYVRLLSLLNGRWSYVDYTYNTTKAAIILSPALGDKLETSQVTITWQADPRVENFWVQTGFLDQLWTHSSGFQETNTSATLNNIPLDGEPFFIRLTTLIDGQLLFEDYRYNTVLEGEPEVYERAARMESPQENTTLTDADQLFIWPQWWQFREFSFAVATSRELLDTDPDLYNSAEDEDWFARKYYAGVDIPLNGKPIYARLGSEVVNNEGWHFVDYRYDTQVTVPEVQPAPQITSPSTSSNITTTDVTFTWQPGDAAKVSRYWLQIGSKSGAGDIYSALQVVDEVNVTSVQVSDIPLNGDPLYVRLAGFIKGEWVYNDYQYSTTEAAPIVNRLRAPDTNLRIEQDDMMFEWQPLRGETVTEYQLRLGTYSVEESAVVWNLLEQSQGTRLSKFVENIPLDGTTLYAQLGALVGEAWVLENYQYTRWDSSEPDNILLTHPDQAVLEVPAAGATFTNAQVSFIWNSGGSGEQIRLQIATSKETLNNGPYIYDQTQLRSALYTVVSDIPLNNEPVYVRLGTSIAGEWYYIDYKFDTKIR